MSSKWFQSDPHRSPDAEFEPGELHHLCAGNEGRLLDFRRTPVRIEKLSDETGLATIQILAFEHQGALWDSPYEDVGKDQFKRECSRVTAEALTRIHEAVTRLNREVEIPCDPLERRASHVIVRMGFVQAMFERCGREKDRLISTDKRFRSSVC